MRIRSALAGAVAGIILTAASGAVISAIAASQSIDGIEVRKVIDMSTTANGKAELSGLQIHPLLGLQLVITLPQGASTAHAIQVLAKFDADNPETTDADARTDNAIGKIVEVRSDPNDPKSSPDNTKRSLSSAEATAGTVDYLVLVSPNFDSHDGPNGLAIIDLEIQLST